MLFGLVGVYNRPMIFLMEIEVLGFERREREREDP